MLESWQTIESQYALAPVLKSHGGMLEQLDIRWKRGMVSNAALQQLVHA
jgi:hypothetical protein